MKKRRTHKIFESDVYVWMTTLRELIRRDVRTLEKSDSYSSCDMEKIWSSCLKKLSPPAKSKDLDDRAYALFDKINAHIGAVRFDRPTQSHFSRLRHTPHQNYLLCARRWCHVILGDLTTEEWYSSCKNSGGSSIGVPYSDTSLERKFKRPISITSEAKHLYLHALSYNPRLWDTVMQYNGCREPSFLDDFDKVFEVVDASRATTVPKNTEITRMIAVEPTGNMYLQQGLMQVMYDRLRSFGLDVTKLPSRHQSLAREGSITGELSTIDFSSASDCLSIELLRYLLPPKWFHYIYRIRCSFMLVNNVKKNLNMISTMGNATTFPLETLVFYALGRAVEDVESNSSTLPDTSRKTRISVFGDDCVVPTRLAKRFISLCEHVGFIVNTEKSFFSPGPGFRESCGGDFLHGIDVRPLYFKWPSSLKGSGLQAWLYNMYNNLSKKYILYFGDCSYYYRAGLRYLRYKLEQCGSLHLVPAYMPSDSGFHAIDSRIKRFVCSYKQNLDQGIMPKRDKHGGITTYYLRFVYFNKEKKYDAIHLQMWLKKHHKRKCLEWSPRPIKTDPFYPIRSRGSYVVAKVRAFRWDAG